MWRLLFALLVIALVICLLAWLVTGQQRYRIWAMRLGKCALGVILAFLLLLAVSRIFAG